MPFRFRFFLHGPADKGQADAGRYNFHYKPVHPVGEIRDNNFFSSEKLPDRNPGYLFGRKQTQPPNSILAVNPPGCIGVGLHRSGTYRAYKNVSRTEFLA